MKSRIFFILVLVIFCTAGAAQSSADFQLKALTKELNKSGIKFSSDASEMTVPSALAARIYKGSFYEVRGHSDHKYKYAYLGRVNSCRAGGCSVHHFPEEVQNSEYFDYFVLFDSSCTVLFVKVYNYQASHGHEITAKGWLKQFVGYNGQNSLVAGKSIDAISGATISVNVITHDIEDKTNILRQLANNQRD